jgi:hypothetical protein
VVVIHLHASVAALLRHYKGSPFSKMKKYDDCPIRTKNGIIIKRKIIRIKGLNPLQRTLLAYIENWDRGCVNDKEYLVFVFNVSKKSINSALDCLAAMDLIYAQKNRDEVKIFCNINYINDVYGEGIEL